MSDRPDLINSEMGGVAFNSVDQCFKQSLLKQMFNESIPLRIEYNTRFFVTVDPAAGGEHSDFAMVSFSYCHGIFKVRSPLPHLCCCGLMPSRQHDEGLDIFKHLVDAEDVLCDGDFLEKVLVRDGA